MHLQYGALFADFNCSTEDMMIKAQLLARQSWRSSDGLLSAIMLAIVLYVAAQLAIPRIRTKLDDWRYGRPRTMLLTAHVGHEEQPGRPTQFIALNLNRQTMVIEIPGGDVAKTRTLTGPYLFGADEDLTPVRITLALINEDQTPDLVVSIKDEEIVYINESGSFRLINVQERAALEGNDG
jgi:hypothetical protein